MIKYAIQSEGEDKVAIAIIGDDMTEMTQTLLGLLELRRDLWQGFDLVKRCGQTLLGIFLD